jgi:hypothetical protein
LDFMYISDSGLHFPWWSVSDLVSAYGELVNAAGVARREMLPAVFLL